MGLLDFLFNRRRSCAECSASAAQDAPPSVVQPSPAPDARDSQEVYLDEREARIAWQKTAESNGAHAVGLERELEEARRWNNRVAGRMALILRESGRLRCEVARQALVAEFWRREFEQKAAEDAKRSAALEAHLNEGGAVV